MANEHQRWEDVSTTHRQEEYEERERRKSFIERHGGDIAPTVAAQDVERLWELVKHLWRREWDAIVGAEASQDAYEPFREECQRVVDAENARRKAEALQSVEGLLDELQEASRLMGYYNNAWRYREKRDKVRAAIRAALRGKGEQDGQA